MLCEKCQKKEPHHHVQDSRGASGETLRTPIDHHFCEDCIRDYIQNDPQLRGLSLEVLQPMQQEGYDATIVPLGDHGSQGPEPK